MHTLSDMEATIAARLSALIEAARPCPDCLMNPARNGGSCAPCQRERNAVARDGVLD